MRACNCWNNSLASPLVAERTSESLLGSSTPRTVTGLRCSTCERMSRPRCRRPSCVPTDGERFNEELFVLLGRRAWEQIRGLVAVDQHWIRWAYLQGCFEGGEERTVLFTIRMLVKCVLSWDDHFVQTNGNVSGTQAPTTTACSLWQQGRVERSSRRRRAKRFGNIKWRVSVVGNEIVHALNQRAGGWEFPSHPSIWPANEGLRRTQGIRRSRFPYKRGMRIRHFVGDPLPGHR